MKRILLCLLILFVLPSAVLASSNPISSLTVPDALIETVPATLSFHLTQTPGDDPIKSITISFPSGFTLQSDSATAPSSAWTFTESSTQVTWVTESDYIRSNDEHVFTFTGVFETAEATARTFTITTTDTAAFVATVGRKASVIRDEVNPELTITSSPAAYSNNQTARFEGRAVDSQTTLILEYRVSSTDWIPVTVINDTFTITLSLVEGEHLVEIRARDAAGNELSATQTVTIDLTAPVLSNLKPSGVISITKPALEVETNEPATCRYSSTDRPYDEMSVNFLQGQGTLDHNSTLSVAAGSTYTYHVACRDLAGNTKKSIISFEVDLETTESELSNPEDPNNPTSPNAPSAGSPSSAASSPSASTTESLSDPVITTTTEGVRVVDINSVFSSQRSFTRTVSVGDVITFTASAESHSITVESVSDDSVKVRVESNPITVVLKILDSVTLDLDQDAIMDIRLTLNNIVDGQADLTVERLWSLPVNESLESPAPTALVTAVEPMNAVVLMGIAILGSVFILILKRRLS